MMSFENGRKHIIYSAPRLLTFFKGISAILKTENNQITAVVDKPFNDKLRVESTICSGEEGIYDLVFYYKTETECGQFYMDEINMENELELAQLASKVNEIMLTYAFCCLGCSDLMKENTSYCKECAYMPFENTEDCSICLEKFGIWVELPCHHAFHKQCLKPLKKNTCPLCRTGFCLGNTITY